MCKFKLIFLVFILLPLTANAAAPTRVYNYVAHTTIDPTQNNANENALYAYLQAGVDTYSSGTITNDAISSIAAISYSKLNLIGSITNNDINASAGIVGSKLNLTSPGIIGSSTPAAGTFTTLTGTDILGTTLTVSGTVKLGTTHQGDIFYDNGTSVVRLTPGVSGQFLKTLGVSANPLWADTVTNSNVVYSWTGQVDAAGSGTGVVNGTTLVDTSTTIGNYLYLKDKNATGLSQTTILLRTKFKKISGISTLTLYAYVNENTNASSAAVSAQLSVNGSTVDTATLINTTYIWVNSTGLDVSGLTNGTVYDMTIAIKTNGNVNPMYGYIGSVIVLGS